MTFKIARTPAGPDATFGLSGRIDVEQLEALKHLIASTATPIVLDLQELKLVDRDGVVFLRLCEASGVELRNCPMYIREWIQAENMEGETRRAD
jgi:anti-anti-sigma regulatory factor